MKISKQQINADQAMAIAKSVFKSNPEIQRLIQRYPPRGVSIGLAGANKGSDLFTIILCREDEPLERTEIKDIDTTGDSTNSPMTTIAKLSLDRASGSFELVIMNETNGT